MYNTKQDIINALQATPDILTALLIGVTQDEALAAKDGTEGWSIVDILCHLRDSEEIFTQRIKRMRYENNPNIAAYDQEKLAVERNYKAEDIHAALFTFIRFRQRNIAIIENLDPEGWARSGNHPEFGRITIFTYTQHKVSHDAVHCAQIARQLSE